MKSWTSKTGIKRKIHIVSNPRANGAKRSSGRKLGLLIPLGYLHPEKCEHSEVQSQRRCVTIPECNASSRGLLHIIDFSAFIIIVRLALVELTTGGSEKNKRLKNIFKWQILAVLV